MLKGLRVDLTARDPVVVRHRIAVAGLPAMRIAVVSDVHCGGWWATREMLTRTVERLNDLEPDLALFGGDAISDRRLSHRRVPLDAIAEELAEIRAPMGLWAVFGNHDWKDDPVARRTDFATCRAWQAFAAAGVPVLKNRAVRLEGFWLVGLDSRRARQPLRQPGLDDVEAAFADVPEDAPVILLAHEPDIFAEHRRAALQVSGHTHGGQIAPLGWTPVVPSDYGSRYAWGHYRDGDRHLVVSGGWGFVGVPLRIGRPPEITIIEMEEKT